MKRFNLLSFVLLLLCCSQSIAQNNLSVHSKNALDRYLNNGDTSYRWEVQDSIRKKGTTIYKLKLTSQTWQSILCKHTQFIIIPDGLKHTEALVFVTGGENKDNLEPDDSGDWQKDGTIAFLLYMAKMNKAVTSLIMQVPVQPLYDGLSEDPLILKTLENFKKTKDYTWPLLIPMTKTVVKSMDAVQEFTKTRTKKGVDKFVVAGGSKRGWVTWLTGAVDKRVVAMAPMVIDILNMPVSMRYQKEAMGDFSILIKPYAELGIAYPKNDPVAQEIVDIIDPYSYKDRIHIPKLVVMGTKDYFWANDAVRIYIDSIAGENHFLYAPNAKHNLGDKKWAIYALNAFFNKTINEKPYTQINEKVRIENGKVIIDVAATAKGLKSVAVWSAESENRDFRLKDFEETVIKPTKKDRFTIEIPLPKTGYKAFYVADKYKMPYRLDYNECSRMYVVSPDKLFVERPAAFDE